MKVSRVNSLSRPEPDPAAADGALEDTAVADATGTVEEAAAFLIAAEEVAAGTLVTVGVEESEPVEEPESELAPLNSAGPGNL
jgi:hypothetical protein